MTKSEKAYQRVEIARSFSFKLNVGNYESRDFFCSQKKECYERDADETSQQLYDFCKSQVMRDVASFKAEMNMTPEEIRARKEELAVKLREGNRGSN